MELIKAKEKELEQSIQAIATKVYSAAAAEQQNQQGSDNNGGSNGGDDNVVDADFTDAD